jgi:phosphatidylglycerophosphatase A
MQEFRRGKNNGNLHDPGQYFVDEMVGLLIMNSSVLSSYVAVVSKPRINVPVR